MASRVKDNIGKKINSCNSPGPLLDEGSEMANGAEMPEVSYSYF